MKKSENDKVSIIVPIYKSEAFINKLVDSILNQTYKNIELILVDDESPDNCPKICDDYAKKDKRVIVIHKKNGGTCDARNVGLDYVSGEYLTFADGDDWMEPDCIEYLLKILKENNANMSTTDAIFTTRDRKQNEFENIKCLNSDEAVCELLYDRIPVGPWNKLYTTSIIKNNNITFSVPWFGEGLYFSVMSAQKSKRMAVGHRKVYNYRLNNPNSGTVVMKVENGINSLENIIFISKNLDSKENKVRYAANWHIWQNYFNLMMFIIGNDSINKYSQKYKECKKYLRKNAFPVAINSDISLKEKIKIVFKALFPKYIITNGLKNAKKAFNNDILK